MNELHLFAGAGGGILGGMLLGHSTVCAVEIDPYCRKVLVQRQRDGILPKFPIWDDVRTFDARPWRGKVDLLCAGFPCKGISAARTNSRVNGECVGIDGGSSELWTHIPRTAIELGYPDLFIENSKQLLTRGLSRIVSTIDAIGYDSKWCVLGPGHFCADHERERLWLKATHSDRSQFKRGSVSGGIYEKYTNARGSSWWKDKPRLERTANGVADQMDRLKAIGNGQVPSVAALAFRILSD